MKEKKLNKSLGNLLHNINVSMKKKLEQELSDFDLITSNQFGVLSLLSKKSISQKEISNATLIDEPSTTRLLDRMIKRDLIGKKRSKEDKRKHIVYITDNGKNLLQNIMPIVTQNNNYVTELFDEDEQETLFQLLNKINAKLRS